ncbi:S8 family serine peptidase [Pyxidicoccus fallax]|uniref:S8 family serine peptidase n=1 Tax=Pyxidicoccus fallax TaxID=394095 RepID=A0A848LL73_9BACT|nr:S8 family serine peptidase [Pyxidicoccus fallax]NMO18430.1 S8 family serine peptidase [Pyxidicoccus fallax]NPC78900.1 S8 family serine peptidase [Pyxidicoccus fallax]
MMRLKSLGWAVTTCAVLGCGSGQPSGPAPSEAQDVLGTGRAAASRGPKKIVEPPTAAPSACTALYSSPQALAALSQAVVDPGLRADGATRTLILSFNTEEALAPALQTLSGLLGLPLGDTLGRLTSLPMVVVKAPVTPFLLELLRAQLQPLGLLSIYEDRPLEYFLDESVAYIGADTARAAFQADGTGIGVGVIDSGIDGTHGDFPNLARNVKIVASPVSGLPLGGALYLDTPNSDLTSGHGTHCASTIAGSGARSGGKYQGVAPGATLIGVGAGDALSVLYSVQGFDFLLHPDVRETHNLRVISNSWGTSGRFAPFHPIAIASKRAYDLGVIVVFAAGNEGPDADTLNPYSASPCVISVAAGTAKDTMGALNPLVSQDLPGALADFSSRGVPGDALHHPDITLPGVNIVAARATTGLPAVVPPYLGLDGLHPEPFYSSISGTSMATPHLAGVIALMLEVNPSLTMDGVLAALTSTAKPMHVTQADGSSRQLEVWEAGAGYADAYAAVRVASETAGTRYTTETTALPGWTGTVGTSIILPVLDVTLLAAEHNHSLAVPAGASALRVGTDWGNPALDLDLYVYGPNGELVASSANGTSTGEAVSIPNPAAGTWRVQLKGFLNTRTQYTGTAAVDRLVPLP